MQLKNNVLAKLISSSYSTVVQEFVGRQKSTNDMKICKNGWNDKATSSKPKYDMAGRELNLGFNYSK